MSIENSVEKPLSLKYYFSDKEVDFITNESGDLSAPHPIYAHESCKIKVMCAGSIENYRRNIKWDFGDGTVVTGYTATHYYKNPGKYIISCTFFDTRLNPVRNTTSITVYVKDVIPTILSVEHEYNMSPTICRTTRLFEMSVTLSDNIISEPTIAARRTFEKGSTTEKSYFDVKDTYQYHLHPYYTFLEEVVEYDFNNDKQWDKTLKPVTNYTPEYHPIYGEFTSDLKWKFYSLKNTNLNKTAIKIFNPASSSTLDYRGNTDNNLYCNEEIEFKNNKSDIPDTASICGKVATFNVWYKTDTNVDDYNNLYFFINQEELKLKNDLQSDTFYINMPPLGISLKTQVANINDLTPLLSFNGFANNADETDKHIESYLKNSLYKNHSVPAISAYYIKNDSVSINIKDSTYNLYKEVPVGYDLSLLINGTIAPKNIKESGDYYASYDIQPVLKNGSFLLEFKAGSNNEKIKICELNELIDLENIIIPAEQLYEEDVDKLITTYTPHALFDEADKFKRLLSAILSNNNMLNYIISRGISFIDDNINHKTCYIDRLLPILESVGEAVTQYSPDLFKNINELRDLTRILSMSYSDLFGNTFNDIYDLSISSTDSGQNIGDRLYPGDIFYFGKSNDKNRAIVAIKRNGIVYPLAKPVTDFIIVEDYSGSIKFGSFETIKPHIFVDFSDQTAEWNKNNKNLIDSIDGAFTLSEYESSWLWNLLLPHNFEEYNNKEDLIYRYYSFYLFNDNNDKDKIRKFNFLKEETIPLKNGKQISYEDWNDINGFTYHCLIKVINDKIRLCPTR